MKKRGRQFLIKDLAIISLSIAIALVLVRTNVLADMLTSTKEMEILGSFLAGIFFTSIFTTAPAIVTLGEIARVNSVVLTAFYGALGATLGDLVIFRLVKDRFSGHLADLIKRKNSRKRVKFLMRLKFFKWITFLVGGLVLASPLPDELGISILQFSKIRQSFFIPFSLIFNFVGIFLIGTAASALL